MILISYIVATYNCRPSVAVLNNTVESLKGLNVEFLIADGGSDDGTLEELHKIPGINIVCSEPDKGIYDAWNKALVCARGKYISFIGIDDIPTKEFITKCESLLLNEKETIGIIYGDAMLQYGNKYRLVHTPVTPKLFYDSCPIFDLTHQGLLHAAVLFNDGSFDPGFKLAADLYFLLNKREKILELGIKKVNCIQAIINADGISMSAKGHFIYLKEYKIIESRLNMKLGYSKFRLSMIGMLSYFPVVYNGLRLLSWKIRMQSK